MPGKGNHKVYRTVTIPLVQEINVLYDEGYSMREIATKLDLCSSTIATYVWHPRKRNVHYEVKKKAKEQIKREAQAQATMQFIENALDQEIISVLVAQKLEKFLKGDAHDESQF